MPKISALLHTHNDALRLGRALDSLRPCDEVLIIDQDSEDETEKVAREHGATFKTAIAGVTSGAYAMDASHEWILYLRCNEALSDELEATLIEWKEAEPEETLACYSVPIRAENGFRNAIHPGMPAGRVTFVKNQKSAFIRHHGETGLAGGSPGTLKGRPLLKPSGQARLQPVP